MDVTIRQIYLKNQVSGQATWSLSSRRQSLRRLILVMHTLSKIIQNNVELKVQNKLRCEMGINEIRFDLISVHAPSLVSSSHSIK